MNIDIDEINKLTMWLNIGFVIGAIFNYFIMKLPFDDTICILFTCIVPSLLVPSLLNIKYKFNVIK